MVHDRHRVVYFLCEVYKREDIAKYPSTFNFPNLTVQLSKPEGQRWLQMGPQHMYSLIPDEVKESSDCKLITEARRLAIQRYVDSLFMTLRLQLEYLLPDTSSCIATMSSVNVTAMDSSWQPCSGLLSVVINSNGKMSGQGSNLTDAAV